MLEELPHGLIFFIPSNPGQGRFRRANGPGTPTLPDTPGTMPGTPSERPENQGRSPSI